MLRSSEKIIIKKLLNRGTTNERKPDNIVICNYKEDDDVAFSFNKLAAALNRLAKRNICNSFNQYYSIDLYFAVPEENDVKVIYKDNSIVCKGNQIVDKLLENLQNVNAVAIKLKISDPASFNQIPETYYILKRRVL